METPMIRAEQARAEAERRYVAGDFQGANGIHGFAEGVVWADANPQPHTITREALLSDEAVERAARVLCAAAGENPDSNESWDEEPPWLHYTDEARAALAAALGEDESNE